MREIPVLIAVLAFALSGKAVAEPAKNWLKPATLGQQNAYQQREKTPLVVFLAKGAPNSCGPGCDQWIAIHGSFRPGADSGLRKLLKDPAVRKLPAYFHSGGGDAAAAMGAGRLLRQYKITASVGTTIPEECEREKRLSAEECDKLKRSGKVLNARLDERRGVCSSACIYALLGGTTRRVPIGARLAIHTSVSFVPGSDGRLLNTDTRIVSHWYAATKKYISEMGVDPKLHDLAMEVPNENARPLKRDEIIRLKIDPRKLIESEWKVLQGSSGPVIEKTIHEWHDAPYNEFEAGSIRLACERGKEITFEYARPLNWDEAEVPSAIQLAGPSQTIEIPRRDVRRDPGPHRVRTAAIPAKFFEIAANAPAIEVTETFLPPSSNWVVYRKLATNGLASALAKLLEGGCR